jgi:glutamate synthase (NADPH/NADH) small chain
MNDLNSQQGAGRFAWRDLNREGLHKRSARQRVADFLEIYGPYDEDTARAQASRCVQCPEPACVAGCPLGNRIPEWLALTAEGQFLEAAALLHSTSSLPEICARVCPADRKCEDMCLLNGKAEPVSIGAIEQFLNEYAFKHGGAETVAAASNGLRVAVIGSGPGGLTCADVLSRRGYAVTVFDWRATAGGLLVSGTPAFRLERSIVERRIAMLERRGVVFRLGVVLGEDIGYSALRESFDAIFVGFGSRKPAELEVPGREFDGVAQALDLLIQEHGAAEGGSAVPGVHGRWVVVVGAGDMALACARTAVRQGAKAVTVVYRRDEASMSCSRREYENAVEEGVRFEFQVQPVAVLGNAAAQVTGLRLQRNELGPEVPEGKRPVSGRPGTEFDLPADHVFLALGFEPVPLPEGHLFGGLERSPGGGIRVDANQMTSVPGVFAGGDLVRGPSTVLEVVRDARRAAQGIHRYLLPRLVEPVE